MVMKSDRKKHGSIEECLKPVTVKRITKEDVHNHGICGKTQRSYTELENYKNTVGEPGALPEVKGIEIYCSECGLVLGYKPHNGVLVFS